MSSAGIPASVAATAAIASTPATSTHTSGFTYGQRRRITTAGDDASWPPIGLLRVGLTLKMPSRESAKNVLEDQ
ncbi:hypothetical protein DM49_3650 [Burkholderia mallei]|nr:hypothetical protein DO73_5287 [Burkholderia pseudomallei]KOS88852.1 hypothetical protein DM49_3650 [Burkholderia mallei]KOT11112.1 hypothetical protein DM77_3004 [Burkholderia mallei]